MPHFETDAAVFRPRFVIVRLGVSLSRLLRELPGFFIREASPSMKPLKFHTPSLTGHSNISAFVYAYGEMYAPILFGGICCTAQCLCVSGRLSVANGKASDAPVSAVRRHTTASTLLSVRVFLTLRPYPQGCFLSALWNAASENRTFQVLFCVCPCAGAFFFWRILQL